MFIFSCCTLRCVWTSSIVLLLWYELTTSALRSDSSRCVLDWESTARDIGSPESLTGRRREANSSFHWMEWNDWSVPHSRILRVILVLLQLWRAAVYSWVLLLVIKPQIFPETRSVARRTSVPAPREHLLEHWLSGSLQIFTGKTKMHSFSWRQWP